MAQGSEQSLGLYLEVRSYPLMIVSKAPIVTSNPKGKPLTNSQEVFSLLNRRFQSYLASQASVPKNYASKSVKRKLTFEEKKPGKCSGETTVDLQSHNLSPSEQYSQSPQSHKERETLSDHKCTVNSVRNSNSTTLKLKYKKSKSRSTEPSASNSPSGNALNQMDCTELAEHVVNRAKVRLKRRSKRDVAKLTDSPLVTNSDKLHQQLKVARTPTKESIFIKKQRSPASLRMISSPQSSIKTPISSPGPSKPLYEKVTTSLPDIPCSPILTSLTPTKTVYLSDQHSLTPKDTGVPNVPPTSPTPFESQQHHYIHSMCDIKSQRQLKNKLQDLCAQQTKLEAAADRQREQEGRKRHREEIARLKAKQRAEIYALNEIMMKHEEEKFKQFISGGV